MTLSQAARWKVASDKEIASLEKHGVYELVPITSVPNRRKVVDNRWVHKIKADGVYKGRLVVLRWSQVPGIDYGGTFATVCRPQSIWMVLAIAAESGATRISFFQPATGRKDPACWWSVN